MTNLIQVSGSVILRTKLSKAFDFLANLENDRLWRKEINMTTLNGPVAMGVRAEESTYFSRRNPQHILWLECTRFELNHQIIYTTIANSKHYLQSVRTLHPITETEVQFNYSVSFDTSLVKAGIGFSLPRFIIQVGAERDLKNYLKALKEVME